MQKRKQQRNEPASNKIALSFEKAVEALLAVKPKPKKRSTKKKKRPSNKRQVGYPGLNQAGFAKYIIPSLVYRGTSGLTPTVSLQFRQRCFIQVGRGILAEIGGRSK
jgi:hypothetical protein